MDAESAEDTEDAAPEDAEPAVEPVDETADAEPEVEPEPGPEVETEADAEAEPEAEEEPEPEVEPEANEEPEPEVEPEAEEEPESEVEPEAEEEPDAEPEAEPEPEAESEPEPEPEDRPREGTLVLAARSVAEARSSVAAPESKPLADKPPARPVGTFVPLVTDDAPSEPPRERTKTMPLPPDPGESLKLLAELTNTPPPPQTPLRTVARRFKIWTPLVLLLLIIFGAVQALRPLPSPELKLTSAASHTFGGSEPSLPWPSEGQAVVEVEGLGSLGSSGKEKAVPIASVAKVMTAYVILRDHPIKSGAKGETIRVDQKAEDQYESGSAEQESVVKVTAGQELSEYEALEAVLLPSANNVARLLARWDAGSETAFVAKMNAVAKELGMTNTTYTDPSGLESTTVSTAKDQVKLGRKAMEMDGGVFAQIVNTIKYTDSNGTSQSNYNQLAGFNHIVGIKTGTSTAAGGNLLFAATREVDGRKQLIIGAMLGQYKSPIITTVLTRSKELIQATQAALTSDLIVKKGDVLGYVDDGLGGHTAVVATKDVTAVGWGGLKVDISLTPAKTGIPHEAKAGTAVGELTVGNGDSEIKIPVALEKDLVEPSLGTKLKRVA
ncbi:D-alanyl-D-alanine carboxypeptidase [Streptomyces sp. NBC_01537]|uniref:D-alanyl-D-alanine carboxypeptidase n=1 Tax=Streptomyces sp. NBC_01537 TaxID=2903896 RepID=UPI00386C9B95